MGPLSDPSSGSPGAAAFSSFFVFPTRWTLTAPLEASEGGHARFGWELEPRAEEVLPRQVLRERIVDGVAWLDSPLDSGLVRFSSSSGIGSARRRLAAAVGPH